MNVADQNQGGQTIPMSTYDDIAEWYDTWVGTHSMREDPFFPAVEAFIGKVAGQRICDLACGQGRVARHLADPGVHVVSIDLSAKLLAIARRHEETEPRGIEYLHAYARSLDGEALCLFDGVVCFLALMDISDLVPTLHSVARMLRPAGYFVFSILHPCFHTSQSGEMETAEGAVRTIHRYFMEGYWPSVTRPGTSWQSRCVPPDALDLCQLARCCRAAACALGRAARGFRRRRFTVPVGFKQTSVGGSTCHPGRGLQEAKARCITHSRKE